VIEISLFLCLLAKYKLFIIKISFIMAVKYRITEAQLMSIHKHLNESVEDESMMETPMEDEAMMETEEEEDETVKEAEATALPKKPYAPEAHNPKHMAKGSMHEEVGKEKFTGTKVAGTKGEGTWDKNVKSGKTPKDGIKSGGKSTDIEKAKAATGVWDGVSKKSADATAHMVKGMKAGEVKNSMGAPKSATKDTAKATSGVAKEATKHVEKSLKSAGGMKDIESAKAKTGTWENAKTGTVNEEKKESLTPKQMKDKKKEAMEAMNAKMDKK